MTAHQGNRPERSSPGGARLGTRLRGAFAQAYDARGKARANLCWAYSPKQDRDVVLTGRLAYGHLLLCEASPDVASVEYNVHRIVAGDDGQPQDTVIDAVATLENGEVQYRRLASGGHGHRPPPAIPARPQCQQVEANGARHVIMTEKDVFANELLIRNWHRVLPWLAQVRALPLQLQLKTVRALACRREVLTLAEILALAEDDESAVFAAAAFKGVQRGLFTCDLDVRPLSLDTLIFSREPAP
jgi:hypothetical protein